MLATGTGIQVVLVIIMVVQGIIAPNPSENTGRAVIFIVQNVILILAETKFRDFNEHIQNN